MNASVNIFRLIRSEILKLTSLRSTWVLTIITIVLNGLIAFVMGDSAKSAIEYGWADPADLTSFAVTAPFQLSLLVAIAHGALIMTSEYNHNTMRQTILADPGRIRTYLAKTLTVAAFWFALELLVLFISSVIMHVLMTSVEPHPELGNIDIGIDFGDSDFLLALIYTAMVVAIAAVFAMSMGAVLRSGAGTMTFTYGVYLILPLIFSIIALSQEWAEDVADYLPLDLSTGATMPRNPSAAVDFLTNSAHTPGTSLAYLLIYLIVVWTIGLVMFKRRDV